MEESENHFCLGRPCQGPSSPMEVCNITPLVWAPWSRLARSKLQNTWFTFPWFAYISWLSRDQGKKLGCTQHGLSREQGFGAKCETRQCRLQSSLKENGYFHKPSFTPWVCVKLDLVSGITIYARKWALMCNVLYYFEIKNKQKKRPFTNWWNFFGESIKNYILHSRMMNFKCI